MESTDVVWLKQLSRGLVWTTVMLIRPSTTVFLLGGEFSHVFNLNNMISNTYKGFLKKKNGPRLPDFYKKFQQVPKIQKNS